MLSQRSQSRHPRSGFFGRSGFTIVEMLIVIVVIAILAAVVLIAYNGVKNRAVDSMLRSSLSSAAQKLETHNVTHGAYPDLLSTIGVVNTDAVHYQYDGPDTENTYCLSATSPQSTSISYHARSGNTAPQPGVCEGHIGPGEEEGEETFSFARTVHGDGPLGLAVHVGEEWAAAEISWTPQAGAQKYEVQSRNPAASTSSVNTFQYRSRADGSGNCASSCTASYSQATPNNTTSLTWTNTLTGMPTTAGQNFEYRLRYQLADGSFSDWDVAQLAYPVQGDGDTRPISGFTVTPNASYTNVTLSWNQVPGFAPDMSKVFYEIVSRNPASSTSSVNTFQYRSRADGAGNCVTTSTSCPSSYSQATPSTTTSLTWTNTSTGAPTSAGQNYEYRIRARIAGQSTYYSAWSDVATVSYPIQADGDVPAAAGLTVTPNPSYTSAAISWNQISNFAPDMSKVFYEVVSRNPAATSSTINTFQYRAQSDGSGNCLTTSTSCPLTYSQATPYNTTSLTWTSTITGVPTTAGQNFEYRMRIRVAGEKTYYGAWSNTITASYPIQSNADVPTVSNFTVVPNGGYTNVTLSWNQISNFAPDMSKVFYEVVSRNPASGTSTINTFQYRSRADGSGNCATTSTSCHSSYSQATPYDTTSLVWTNTSTGVPASSGQTFEYRIRIRVAGETTYYGNWSPTVQVAH